MAQWARLATQILSIVVLSQLLQPGTFGLVAMVTSVVGVATIIGDFGLSLSALAGSPPDQNQRSKLFIVNSTMGLVLSIAIALLARPLADFYGRPELTHLTLAIAPIFALNALAVQFKVEMNLQKAWLRLAATETIPPVLGFLAAVVVAAIHPTPWALIVQQCLAASLQLILAVTLAGWRPSRPSASSGIRSHLRFGRDTLAGQAFVYVSSNVDNVLIGHSLGSVALGQYSRAFQLGAIPVSQVASPLTRALVPSLARTKTDAEFEALAVRYHRVLTYVLLAPLSLMIAAARPGVSILLGTSWSAVPSLLQVLCLGSVFQSLGYIFYWCFVARRATRTLVLTEAVSRTIFVLSLFAITSRGAIWVAWCVAAGQLLLLVGSAIVTPRVLPVRITVLAVATVRPVLLFGSAAVAGLIVDRVIAAPHMLAALPSLLVDCAAWGACVVTALGLPRLRYRAEVTHLVASLRGAEA